MRQAEIDFNMRKLREAMDALSEHFDTVLILAESVPTGDERGSRYWIQQRGSSFAAAHLALCYAEGDLNTQAFEDYADEEDDGDDWKNAEVT